jgi:DNA-binding HxlR family transcriptional regulator
MRKQRHDPAEVIDCPMEAALDLVGGKWKGVILFRISEKTRRFNELHRIVCKVTPRMLTKQLRELEADGLVRRTVYAEVPPRVEYDLTGKGQTLIPVLKMLMDWGAEHALPVVAQRHGVATRGIKTGS